jgi:hypothetical protein
MSFTGDLEHLPIVDLIQLMNSTRKTGVLTVNGRKGESQLIFKEGYIVSANHLNNSVRIGDMLIARGVITPDQLEQALQKQQLDGADRKPLAITMIEMGALGESDAFKALQSLIEMTVVEILTWKSGKFTLDHLKDAINCDFRYYPERMNHEININTQSILMDALRIFDERMRDGLIEDEPEETFVPSEVPEDLISADDLGLGEIDAIAAPLPQPFKGAAPFNPLNFQLEKLQSLAPELSSAEKMQIATFLADKTTAPETDQCTDSVQPKLVLAGTDSLLAHALETVAKAGGVSVAVARSNEEIEQIVESIRQNGGRARVVFDTPQCIDPPLQNEIIDARAKLCSRYPGLPCIQLTTGDSLDFALDAYRCGIRAVMPRPSLETHPGSFAGDFIKLVAFLPSYLR